MLFSIDKKRIESIPHKKDYDAWREQLTGDQYTQIMEILEKEFNNNQVRVSSFIPGKDWDYPYYYIYEACGKDYTASALFFGLLVWETAMRHNDAWSFIKNENVSGITYFKIDLGSV